jgi:hypothetical protein
MSDDWEICDGCGLSVEDGWRIYTNRVATGPFLRRGRVSHLAIECQRAAQDPVSDGTEQPG